MALSHILFGANTDWAALPVRRIGPVDLTDALAKGWNDFSAMPSHAIFLCLMYPIIGIELAGLTLGNARLPFLFPLAAGFALIGPFAAMGLYELSRHREAGVDVSAGDALDVLYSPSIGAIVALGTLLMVIFLIWIATANAIHVLNFGYVPPASISQFINDVLFTPPGWKLILIGNGIGFLFAVVVFSISFVSFPLLLDCDIGAVGALLTSIRAIQANPMTMALWGLIVVGLLVAGSLPAFLGLTVALPVLGHSTWHLYRKIVEPAPNPRSANRPRAKGLRYAADFPAVLFPWAREYLR